LVVNTESRVAGEHTALENTEEEIQREHRFYHR